MTRECLALVHHNVPFDVAFSLPNDHRVAWLIMFGEMEGNEFDFENFRWKERK